MKQLPKYIESIRGLVEGVVADQYSEELPYFQLIWETFRRRILDPTSELESLGGVAPDDLVVGFPFAGGSGPIPLVAPVALLAVWGTFLEMQSQRVLPSQEQVESAICSAATALGAGRKVAGELAHKLAPRLHALFGSDQGDWLLEAVDTSESAAPAGVAGSEESVVRGQEEGTWPRFEGLESVVGPNDMVYVDRFEDGEWLRNVRMTLNEAQTLAKMRAYDIVVDEAVHTFQIGGSAARPTTRLRPPQRGMLWLLLMNAKGGFSYDAVRQLFRIGKLEGNESIQRCVYQLRLLLGKERGKCVIDRGASEHYFVSPEGWSFLWIRRRKDNMRSELYVGPSNARSS